MLYSSCFLVLVPEINVLFLIGIVGPGMKYAMLVGVIGREVVGHNSAGRTEQRMYKTASFIICGAVGRRIGNGGMVKEI